MSRGAHMKVHGRRREAALLKILIDAAERGEPCPGNAELAGELGLDSIASPVRLMQALERQGLIEVERSARARRVTILASGKQTAAVGAGDLDPRSRAPKKGPEARAEREAVRREYRRMGPKRKGALAGSNGGDPGLVDGEIQQRAEERQAERRAHEQKWLREEQRKYGLPRKGMPLSEMIA